MACSCTGLMHIVASTMSSYVQLVQCVQKTLFPCSYSVPLADSDDLYSGFSILRELQALGHGKI